MPTDVKNYIYTVLIKERFRQIRDYMLKSRKIPKSSDIITMENSFSVFIIVIDQDDSVFIYK